MKNGGDSRRKERSGKGQGSLITPPYFEVWTLPSHCDSLNEQPQSECCGKTFSLRSSVGKIIKNQT